MVRPVSITAVLSIMLTSCAWTLTAALTMNAFFDTGSTGRDFVSMVGFVSETIACFCTLQIDLPTTPPTTTAAAAAASAAAAAATNVKSLKW